MWLARFAFQACSFNHSDISPFRINNLRSLQAQRLFCDCDKSSKSDALTFAAIKYTVSDRGLD